MNRLFIFLISYLAVLLQTGCRTTKEITDRVTATHRSDSVSELRIIKTLGIPESRAELTIPIRNIVELPAGASFSERSGRAQVQLSRRGDIIHTVATCDSLQALCEYYRRELVRIRNDTGREEKTVVEKRSNCTQLLFKGIFVGLLVGSFLIILIKIKKRI